MKLFLKGTISTEMETFIPATLWFSNEQCEDNTTPGENCICLESVLSECTCEESKWDCRWKGVTLTNEKEYGEVFTKEFLLNLIKERNLTVTNMDACYSEDVEIEITSIMLLDGEWGTETYLDKGLFSEKIEFIAD